MAFIERTFSPSHSYVHRFLGRCPRLVWARAFGPGVKSVPRKCDDKITGCIPHGPRAKDRHGSEPQLSKGEIEMDAVTVSPRYHVLIPKAVRERAGIRPGDKLQVLSFDDRIEFIRTRPMSKMRGFLHGLDPTFVRDEEDRVCYDVSGWGNRTCLQESSGTG